VIFGLVFRQLAPDATSSFVIMGIVVLISPVLSLLIRIKGHAGLLVGVDRAATKSRQTLQVPENHGSNKEEEEDDGAEEEIDLDDINRTKDVGAAAKVQD
jgi:hypothetical protein